MKRRDFLEATGATAGRPLAPGLLQARPPESSAVVLRGVQERLTVLRGVDIQQAWDDMTGADPVLPQAGLAVTQSFLEGHSNVMPRILDALQQATAAVLADPAMTAADTTSPPGQTPPLIQSSIAHSKLVATPATAMRPQIESMLLAMADEGMGGSVAHCRADAFYLWVRPQRSCPEACPLPRMRSKITHLVRAGASTVFGAVQSICGQIFCASVERRIRVIHVHQFLTLSGLIRLFLTIIRTFFTSSQLPVFPGALHMRTVAPSR